MGIVQSSMVATGRARRTLYMDTRVGTYDITKAEAEDATLVVEMVPVFDGETVVQLEVISTDISTGADITLDVGDGDNDDLFSPTALTIGQAGGSSGIIAGGGKSYSVNDTLDISILVAATTGAAGTLTMIAVLA